MFLLQRKCVLWRFLVSNSWKFIPQIQFLSLWSIDICYNRNIWIDNGDNLRMSVDDLNMYYISLIILQSFILVQFMITIEKLLLWQNGDSEFIKGSFCIHLCFVVNIFMVYIKLLIFSAPHIWIIFIITII